MNRDAYRAAATNEQEIDLQTVLARIAASLERLERRLDQSDRRFDAFADAYLNARFPYGRATDRWGHRGRGTR